MGVLLALSDQGPERVNAQRVTGQPPQPPDYDNAAPTENHLVSAKEAPNVGAGKTE